MTLYCGREFSSDDIQTIKQLIEQDPKLKRTPLSRKLCELFGWRKPNGELKDMTCRVALLRMQADGLLTLPPSQLRPGARTKLHFPPTAATDAQTPLLQPVHELEALSLRAIAAATDSRLWNEYIARYHYLGYTPMSGAQMRYNVFVGERLVALLSFGASAWKLAGRESYIGWQQADVAQEPATRRQQRPLPDPAVDPVQGTGLQDPVQDRPAVAARLASAIRLSPGHARDVRGVRATSRDLLQGSELGPCRTDHWTRQEEPRPPPDHPDQGHLAVPVAQGLRSRLVQLNGLPAAQRLWVHRTFTGV